MNDALTSLREHGYAVLPRLLDETALAAARARADELLATAAYGDSDFDGRRTRRVYQLLGRLGALERPLTHPEIRALVDAQLGADHQLGMLFLSAVDPGQGAQLCHYDAGIYPVGRDIETETNVIWALDDFTEDNGATLIAPGSHRWPAERRAQPADLIPAVMPAGSALVYSGRLWHGAGHNRSGASRRALISEHLLPWLRPADNHALALGAAGLRALPPHLRPLAGVGAGGPYFAFVGGRPVDEWLDPRPGR